MSKFVAESVTCCYSSDDANEYHTHCMLSNPHVGLLTWDHSSFALSKAYKYAGAVHHSLVVYDTLCKHPSTGAGFRSQTNHCSRGQYQVVEQVVWHMEYSTRSCHWPAWLVLFFNRIWFCYNTWTSIKALVKSTIINFFEMLQKNWNNITIINPLFVTNYYSNCSSNYQIARARENEASRWAS